MSSVRKNKRFTMKVVLAIVFFMTISVAGIVSGVYDIVFGLKSRYWPNETGTIHTILHGIKWSGATVFYGYWVDGKYYKKHNIGYGKTIRTKRKAKKLYPVGSSVTVYYDSDKPSRSVLEPGYHILGLGQIIGGLAMGGLGLLGIWLYKR